MTFPLGRCPRCKREETIDPCPCGYKEEQSSSTMLWIICAVMFLIALLLDFSK